jgi:GxxExxY protein
MIENVVTSQIINAAMEVHKTLGPGLLESSYENCLAYLLNKRGLKVEKQKHLPLVFHEVKLEAGYRIDLLIENMVVVEVKAADAIIDIHMAQILTYLRLSNCRVGLILNFNTVYLKDGIRRVINT